MTTQPARFFAQRLPGKWALSPEPLTAAAPPLVPWHRDSLSEVGYGHLQPLLYPEQPYWGDHLRAINDYAWVYQHIFRTPHRPFQRARLLLEGVDYFVEVWLNGQWLGRHEGHFAPFTFDVTDTLVPPGSENQLTVRVTAPWDAPNPRGTYPTDHVVRGLVKGLYEHGEGLIPPNVHPIGIWRPVWLLTDQGLSIDHVRIRTTLDGSAALRLTVTNASAQSWDGRLQTSIAADNHDGPGTAASLSLHLPPGTHEIDRTLHVPDARLWWPWDQGEPHLYRLRSSLIDRDNAILHSTEEVFGFRSVQLERSPERFVYRINERPVFIRGSSYIPALYLSQCDEATLGQDVVLAKAANLNLLRVHVHVSPPELYALCDQEGMMIWQDFELNWVHDPSPAFEARARAMQQDMIRLLGNHPSLITWSCHNEPTMVFTRRHNLEQRPGPALYEDAREQDPTRPVFLCSGQLEQDWRRSGDTHSYYGAIWTRNYTDVLRHRPRLNTEFGFEAPASAATLQTYDFCWQRLQHLEGQIEALWAYQAELIQFHVEHFRRLRAETCAGYVHFWLVDLVPQVGCGVLDAQRQPKGGYAALRRASQPLHIALEHDDRKPLALWVFNDTAQAYSQCTARWSVSGADGALLITGDRLCDVAANASQRLLSIQWPIAPQDCARVTLTLLDSEAHVLAENSYEHPFQPRRRPRGYPWNFDMELGTKVFDREDATSMIAISGERFLQVIPLPVRERIVEWGMRQRFPPWLLSFISRVHAFVMRL